MAASIYKYNHSQQKNHTRSNKDWKMGRLLSFLKVISTTTLLFLFFQTGSGRELIVRSSKGVDHFATTAHASHPFHESREMMELDYDDAGPNTKNQSGFTQLPSSPEAPAPQA